MQFHSHQCVYISVFLVQWTHQAANSNQQLQASYVSTEKNQDEKQQHDAKKWLHKQQSFLPRFF